MNKKIKILVDNKEIDYYEFADVIRDGDYFYKENDEWYLHKKPTIEEDKKIEKIDLSEWAELTYQEDWEMLTRDFNRNCILFVNKINEIIDYLNNKENK